MLAGPRVWPLRPWVVVSAEDKLQWRHEYTDIAGCLILGGPPPCLLLVLIMLLILFAEIEPTG